MHSVLNPRRGGARTMAALLLILSLLVAACGAGGNEGPPGGPPDTSATAAPDTGAITQPTDDASAGGQPTVPPADVPGDVPGVTPPTESPGDLPAGTQAPSGPTVAAVTPNEYNGDPATISVWTYPQGDDEKSLKAYKAAFEKANPSLKVQIVVYPEGDPYFQKVNTSLQARKPPDIAVMEDRAWMQAGRVVELTDLFPSWGVSVGDYYAGGLARGTPNGSINEGVYAIGDFLGGNVIFYNRKVFDDAGVKYPPADRSLTIQEYAELCRKVAKPDPNPRNALYGCAMPEWGYGIQAKDVFGQDGHQALGNMNSPDMIEAFNICTDLIRERISPSSTILGTVAGGTSDLFAQGRLAMTWSDFTQVDLYKAQKIDFGLAPFYVLRSGESFVDTWTAPYGTFTESPHKEAALHFLRFIATDAQRIRVQTSPDPPLSRVVVTEVGYGQDDPAKAQYLVVLRQSKAQVFVPPGVDAWDPSDVQRKMTIGRQEASKPLLDPMAQKAQQQLERAWQQWERLKPK